MKMQTRTIICFIIALLAITPLLIEHPGKAGAILFFFATSFLSVYAITSLFNIKNINHKIFYLSAIALFFAYKFYSNYILDEEALAKAIIVTLASAGVMAFIMRFLSILFNGKETKKTKVYSVTDEVMANHLISLLDEKGIEAFVDKFRLDADPVLRTASDAKVDIMIKDKSDFDKAMQIITAYFEEQQNIEPWQCPKCLEQIEEGFSSCWKCGYEKDEVSH